MVLFNSSYKILRKTGSKGSKNFIIEEKNTGLMNRDSSNIDDSSLVVGTLNRVLLIIYNNS
jgi:hypothetical protein